MNMKQCNCCEFTHTTFEHLTPLGSNYGGHFYNCECGSTLLFKEELHELFEEADSERRREMDEDEFQAVMYEDR